VKRIRLHTLMWASILFVACGGGSDDDVIASLTNVQLSNFSVQGTSTNNGTTLINSAVNSGNFSVSWTTSPDTHRAELFLSDSASSNGAASVEVLGLNCVSNSPAGLVNCSGGGTQSCSFDGINTIACANAPSPVNVSRVVTELPKNVFLVMKACPLSLVNCVEMSAPVQLN